MALLAKFLVRIQPLIILALIALFFYEFGLPAYERWSKKEVFIKEYALASKPLEVPAVTLCVQAVRK